MTLSVHFYLHKFLYYIFFMRYMILILLARSHKVLVAGHGTYRLLTYYQRIKIFGFFLKSFRIGERL